VLNQRSVLLTKVGASPKVKCFLIRYFSYTQNVTSNFNETTTIYHIDPFDN